MNSEFTAIIEQDENWYIAHCPEIPGANGQGCTIEECRANLTEAIALILEDRLDSALRGIPPEAIRETVGSEYEARLVFKTFEETRLFHQTRKKGTLLYGAIRKPARPKPCRDILMIPNLLAKKICRNLSIPNP